MSMIVKGSILLYDASDPASHYCKLWPTIAAMRPSLLFRWILNSR